MNWSEMFFQNWEGIIRTVIVGILAYATLVVFLRISGKRSLSKLNAFDLVVTVALGSVLASILLQESVALAEGATALALLLSLQFLVTFSSVRSKRFAKAVRSDPTLLVRAGNYCENAMKQERITHDEVMSAARSAGASDVGQVDYAVLEGDGTISVAVNA